jgi:NAD(P)-dependent dehydrogenase (short-subunit alcohol dehydrogenase family)
VLSCLNMDEKKQTGTVFITGASSGLGLSHAIYLTSLGYKVIGTSRDAAALDLTNLKRLFLEDHTKYYFSDKDKREVKKGALLAPRDLVQTVTDCLKKIEFISMDITDGESVRRAVNSADAAAPVDVVINNAGIFHWGSLEETAAEEAAKLFDVDFFGQMRVLQAFIPRMRTRGRGLIINTTSMASVVGLPFFAYYSAAKAAMERVTEAFYTELRPFGIRVSSLLPGDINTAINANLASRHGKNGRCGSTDVGKIINSLTTPENSAYFKRSLAAWEIFVRNHIVAPPPFLVSRKIARIIRSQNPKVHYKVGNFMQAKLLPVLKALLPDKLFLHSLAKVFGI